MVGVPTGFADLDALTNGLHPGQLVIIAARPAIGKSTLGLDLARSASIKNGLTSVIFSLEMARNEIVMRLLSAEAQVPLAHMRSGTMSDADWQKLARKIRGDRRGADVHRRLAEHVDDGDPRQVPAAEAEARPAPGDRGLPAADELGEEGGVPPAGGRGVLPGAEAAGQGARGAGDRDRPAEPWSRAAPGQEADDERPARVRLPRAGRRRGHPAQPGGRLREGVAPRRRGRLHRRQAPQRPHRHHHRRLPGPLLAASSTWPPCREPPSFGCRATVATPAVRWPGRAPLGDGSLPTWRLSC